MSGRDIINFLLKPNEAHFVLEYGTCVTWNEAACAIRFRGLQRETSESTRIIMAPKQYGGWSRNFQSNDGNKSLISFLLLLSFSPPFHSLFLSISAPSQFPDHLAETHTTVLAPYATRDTSTVTLATLNASNSIFWALSHNWRNYQGVIM